MQAILLVVPRPLSASTMPRSTREHAISLTSAPNIRHERCRSGVRLDNACARAHAQPDSENWSLSDDEERLALAMRQEDPKVAKRIALPVLSSAVARKSRHLEGRVLTLLAQCESLLANSGSAYELSSRALLYKIRDYGLDKN